MEGTTSLTTVNLWDNRSVDSIYSSDSTQYFEINELSSLLERNAYVCGKEGISVEDKWSKVNNFRAIVSSALNKGLSDILSQNIKGEHPIVEIGSGIGYKLPESISAKTIRIQPGPSECELLKRSISDPIYQMNIEDLYNSLVDNGKKIPLFFALNVFDTMSTDERKANLLRISQLQNPDDRILIMLDTNPLFDKTIKQLESLYPKHVALPYFPPKTEYNKFSVIMVPVEFIEFNPNENELLKIIEQESRALALGYLTEMQYGLSLLQNKLNLKVVALEDFFVDQVKEELNEIGYTSNIYYHASFTAGDLPAGFSTVKQDLLYKSVTDSATVRQWCLTDENLLNRLSKKGLSLPDHFNDGFLSDLKEKGQKILGAEILVIEAKKI